MGAFSVADNNGLMRFMKKAKILRVSGEEQVFQPQPEMQDYQNSDTADVDKTISKEVVRKKPVRIGDKGFTAWTRKMKPTEEGMESEVEEPLIIAKSGHRIKESEIKGQCDVCSGYDKFIFNCYACKKSLCLKHVCFFKEGDKEVPYCQRDWKERVYNTDTWQQYEGRTRRREKNEK
jgi:hypothetical protein